MRFAAGAMVGFTVGALVTVFMLGTVEPSEPAPARSGLPDRALDDLTPEPAEAAPRSAGGWPAPGPEPFHDTSRYSELIIGYHAGPLAQAILNLVGVGSSTSLRAEGLAEPGLATVVLDVETQGPQAGPLSDLWMSVTLWSGEEEVRTVTAIGPEGRGVLHVDASDGPVDAWSIRVSHGGPALVGVPAEVLAYVSLFYHEPAPTDWTLL